MHCVVTGWAGFIGSNLVDALVARGYRGTVLDNSSTGKKDHLREALAASAGLEVADMVEADRVAPRTILASL
jgi:UDP-glucose 4-epimerase